MATRVAGKEIDMIVSLETRPQQHFDWMKFLQVTSLVLGIMVSLKSLNE